MISTNESEWSRVGRFNKVRRSQNARVPANFLQEQMQSSYMTYTEPSPRAAKTSIFNKLDYERKLTRLRLAIVCPSDAGLKLAEIKGAPWMPVTFNS